MALPSIARSISLNMVSVFVVVLLGCETTTVQPQSIISIPKYSRFTLQAKHIQIEKSYVADNPVYRQDTILAGFIGFDNSKLLYSRIWKYNDVSYTTLYDSSGGIMETSFDKQWQNNQSVRITPLTDSTISFRSVIINSSSYSDHRASGSGSSSGKEYLMFNSNPIKVSNLSSDSLIIEFRKDEINTSFVSISYEKTGYTNNYPNISSSKSIFLRLLPQTDSSALILKMYK